MFPQSFFAKANGKVVSIRPDGNRFYRDISYQLFGTEKDSKIYSVISQMERFNKDVTCIAGCSHNKHSHSNYI